MISPFPRSPDPHSDNMHAKASMYGCVMRMLHSVRQQMATVGTHRDTIMYGYGYSIGPCSIQNVWAHESDRKVQGVTSS